MCDFNLGPGPRPAVEDALIDHMLNFEDPIYDTGIFASPTFVDLNGDSIPDAVLIGLVDGKMSLGFAQYSSGSGDTGGNGQQCVGATTCVPGMMLRECQCIPCPPGTYKSTFSADKCTVCGVGKVCGISAGSNAGVGAIAAANATAGMCSAWLPFPNTVWEDGEEDWTRTTYSPDYVNDRDLPYVLWWGDVQVIDQLGYEVPFDNLFGANVESQMFGGFRWARNMEYPCPKLYDVTDSLPAGDQPRESTKLVSHNQTHIDFEMKAVVPSLATAVIKLKNADLSRPTAPLNKLSMNMSLAEGTPYWIQLQDTRTLENAAFSTPLTIRGDLNPYSFQEATMHLVVDTGAIPDSFFPNTTGEAEVANSTVVSIPVEVVFRDYWSQVPVGVRGREHTIVYTLHIELVEPTVLVLPSEFSLDMEADAGMFLYRFSEVTHIL